MKTAELLEIIRTGESSKVEFKKEDVHPVALAEEIVAFANLEGGTILIGVGDDGTITGCNRKEAIIFVGGRDDKLKQRVAAALNRAAIPAVACNQQAKHGGRHPDNICNRGLTGKGVQLEISRPLRNSPQAWRTIAAAIGEALEK